VGRQKLAKVAEDAATALGPDFAQLGRKAETTRAHELITQQIYKDSPMARTVQCIKLGTEAEGLDFPPYPGELGKRIYQGVSKQAWADWLKHQTMLVNENRLNLADARARQYLARQMEKHFFGEGADQAAGYVPPSQNG
jgi:Fe-S cluster biosynthesis and repair protein YggX